MYYLQNDVFFLRHPSLSACNVLTDGEDGLGSLWRHFRSLKPLAGLGNVTTSGQLDLELQRADFYEKFFAVRLSAMTPVSYVAYETAHGACV